MPKNIDNVIQHPTWSKAKEITGAFTIRDARVVEGKFGECVQLDLTLADTGENVSVSVGVDSNRQQLVDYFASQDEPVGPCRFSLQTIESGQWAGSEYRAIVSADSIVPEQSVKGKK